jgi:hypothetical protein
MVQWMKGLDRKAANRHRAESYSQFNFEEEILCQG